MISPGPTASISMQGATLDDFCKLFRLVLDRPVINKTGMTGQFDFRVEFGLEGTRLAPPQRPVGGQTAPPESTGASIFTALEEQLGLKLESGKGPIETLVIDHIERPSEN